MRQFKILKWPKGIAPKPTLKNPYPCVKELYDYYRGQIIFVLDVGGINRYFYPDEVKEVTNG